MSTEEDDAENSNLVIEELSDENKKLKEENAALIIERNDLQGRIQHWSNIIKEMLARLDRMM